MVPLFLPTFQVTQVQNSFENACEIEGNTRIEVGEKKRNRKEGRKMMRMKKKEEGRVSINGGRVMYSSYISWVPIQ